MNTQTGPDTVALPPKKSSFMKKLAKRLAWLIGILLFLLLLPLILLLIYEKEIKNAIVSEINTHLNSKVYIEPDNIAITFIKTFPNAALCFNDVTMMGSLEDLPNDTLLHAEKIYLTFSLADIWNKKYIVQKIEVANAKIGLLASEIGETNYDIWKKEATPVKDQGKSADFKLSKVAFNGLAFSYKNIQKKVKAVATFKEVDLSGNFSDKIYLLDIKADGFIQTIRADKRNYFKNKKLSLAISAQVNDNTYTIEHAEVGLNKLFFTINGSLTDKENEMPADINFKGKNIDVQSILSLLPESFHTEIKDYESEGVFYSDITLKGDLNDYNALDIEAKFGTDKAGITHTPTKTTLSDVSFNGTFSKKKFNPELLSLKEIKVSQGGNFISGDFSLSNFDSPYLKLSAKGNYNLHDFFALVPVDTISSAAGLIDFSIEANINLNDAKARKIGTSSASGKIDLKDVQLTFKGENEKALQIPGGQILITNENLETNKLQIIHGRSSLELSGKAQNFLNYLLKPEQPLHVELDVRSDLIDADDFVLPSATKTVQVEKAQNPFNLQDNISADLKLQVNEVVFRQFKGKNLHGQLVVKNKKLLAQNFSFEAFEGDITLTGIADASKAEALNITGNAKLVDVNIRHMFKQLNNFGQGVIESENINGKTTTQIDFSASWNDKLQCTLSSIEASADVNIDKGELVNYKMLEYLAEYVKLEELKRVKFANLQTHVDIKNQVILLSKTSLKNSALDIEISGTHTFDNVIDYRIKLRLSDWLAKRPGKSKQLEEELSETENDPENKRCIFLHMTGTVDKPVITYDRKGMRQKIKEDIKEEKNNLKKILNEEFGWFKKDTTLKKEEKKPDQKFKIDFNQKKKEKDEDEEDF